MPEAAEEEITTPAPKKSKATKAETAEEAQQKAREAYQALIDYCQQHKHDIKAVAKTFSLNAKSTAQEFETAMRRLILADSKQKDESGSDEPVEV